MTKPARGVPAVGSVRRKVPAPFTRPTLTVGAARRVWQHVPVSHLRSGDTLPDLGLISAVAEEFRAPDPTGLTGQQIADQLRWVIIFYNEAAQRRREIPGHEQVWAFTRPRP